MMDGPRNQQEAERLRWLQTEEALRRLRVDLQLRGVDFKWKRVPATATSPGRLEAFVSGAAPRPWDHAALALTLLRPLFLHAVIEAGDAEDPIPGVALGDGAPPRRWFVVLWLDAPAAEALRREDVHPDLADHVHRVESEVINRVEPTGDRCPHDGAACTHHCVGGPCAREVRGWNLSNPWEGYPSEGHVYPAKGIPLEER